MSQNSNEKTAMLTKLATINQVEGFDPEVFAVEYTDLNTGETRKRLPVMAQMAWFQTEISGRPGCHTGVSRQRLLCCIRPGVPQLQGCTGVFFSGGNRIQRAGRIQAVRIPA